MKVYSASTRLPYFGVMLSSKLASNEVMYRVMSDKLMALAQDLPGYLGAEWAGGEIDIMVTYWQTEEDAAAWTEHPVQRRILSLGKDFWYLAYSLKQFQVVTDDPFIKADQASGEGERFPRVVTKRGILTLLEASHTPLLYDYVNQEKDFLAPWEPTRSDAYYSLETCQLRIREMRRDFLEDRGVVLCFLSPEEDKMLAYTNFSNVARGVFQSCNLGYSLRQSEQGKGIMQEALEAGLHYLHKEWHIDRIQACYMPRNARSAAVLQKLGFDKEGLAKRYLKINGQWEDHVLTALLLR
ncbi:GNAT family N-acetyltransferase [Marinomonas algarum]|uniref:GNAT family N-acetyltransferase n=1 Tax=Marinomonas algarum TaxID=2883105 RepID=A0A9X1IKV7_9GAMM|nr:GNAT family N-acetyltransferase [Marinomonas algarum]MCB5160639.1 GNAT family N-acetyltransferase [Marinomonas algarum]